jgi:hypothetical protein
MVNRESIGTKADAKDVDGYDHVLKNNLSYGARTASYAYISETLCTLENNTFLPTISLSSSDFKSLDGTQMLRERQADGSLPEITFLKLKSTSVAYERQIGYQFDYETVVSGIQTVSSPTGNDAVYTLSGVRMEQPGHKGIYIRNGKKIIR